MAAATPSARSPAAPAESPEIQEIAGWKAWIPFGFVALVLVLLVGAPVLNYREMRTAAEEFSERVVPGRIMVGRITTAIARASASIRTYAITGNDYFREVYHMTRLEEAEVFQRLRETSPELGADTNEALEELERRAGELHVRHDRLLAGELSVEAFLAELPAQDTLFEAALGAANGFGTAVDQIVARDLEALRETTRLFLLVTIAAALLSLTALVLLIRIGRELRRRMREETSLRNAALALAGTVRVEEMLHRIARSAVEGGYGDNAHVEQIDAARHEIEIVATAGHGTPPLGTRVPYPGSLAEAVIRTGESEIVPDVSRAGRPISVLVGKHCGACAGLVVPLMADQVAQGALVLLREAGSPYGPRDLLAPRILGVLAALALRRASLFQVAEERRQEVERIMASKARLTRGLSHDLKNPLGAADGYAQILEKGMLGGLTERQQESLGRMRASIRSAIALIDDLHELARAEAGQLAIRPEPVDIGAIAAELAEDHRAEAEGAGLELSVGRGEPLPPIETDPRRVRQILGNLISNAIKYTPEGGRVRVSWDVAGGDAPVAAGEWIAVRVSDSGPGIPEDRQEEIFLEFSRLEPEATHGAGLGLAISRRIARLLGGDITVESAVDRGSSFTLWLPSGGVRELPGPARERAAPPA